MISRTIFLNLDRLARDDKLAAIIIRLMMACNDISLANSCFTRHEDDKQTKNKYISIGACMYFVRLQIGHIHEGFKIVREIRSNQRFSHMTQQLSQHGQKCFDKLCACIDGRDGKWKKYFIPIRQNLAFHYNDSGRSKLILHALKDRISKKGQKESKITIGSVQKVRFELGDEIVDTIVCRDTFGIPYEVDLQLDRSELDKILMYGSGIGEAFLSFGTEFIYKIAEN